MLRTKYRLLFFVSLLVCSFTVPLFQSSSAYAGASQIVNPDASVSRINRPTLYLGTIYFYDSNTTDDDWTFHSINTDCPATIKYESEGSGGDSGPVDVWTLSYQKKNESGGECGPDNTKRLSMPKNWSERQNVVLVGGSSDGKVISVMPDNNTIFKKGGTYNGNTVFIQQGVDARSCPLVFAINSRDTVLIPLEKKTVEDSVSNQVKELFNRELGIGDTACGPTDNDSLGIFSQFGLPESYYDAGTEKDHYQHTDFGFDGENVASATMYMVSIAQGAGIAAQGPLSGGGYSSGDDGASTPGGGSSDTTSCAVDGIGWIVCPVMKFLGIMNDAAFGFINNFLEIRPALFTDPAARSAWGQFRNLANVAFVVAFLVIIYSQITGAGVSNYGLKKLLPKLVIAAVLVNVSFWICAIMVDLSNILGGSLYDLFKSLAAGIPGDSVSSGGAASSFWTDAAGWGLTVIGGVGLLLLIILAPSSLLAFALIILILIARQALVILLIVLSPLAFVAYLLPNTEQWFKKWWKAMTTTLMVYPIIGLVFGASTLASTVLLNVSQANPGGGGDDEQMLKLVAAAVLAVPLFAVPVILKGSISAAGSIGQKLSGFADKAGKNSMQKSRLGAMKQQFDRNRQVSQAQRWGGRGKSWDPRTRLNRGLNKVSGKYGTRIAGTGAEIESKIANEDVDRQASLMQKNWTAATTIPEAQKELGAAIKAGDTTRARAANKILLGSGSKGVAAAAETLSRSVHGGNVNDQTVQFLKSDITGAGLKSKDAALDAWSRDNSGATVENIASRPGTLNALTDTELAGQSVQRIAEGGVSTTRAGEIMGNDAVWSNMSEDKKGLIRAASAGQSLSGSTTHTRAHEEARQEDNRRQQPPSPPAGTP